MSRAIWSAGAGVGDADRLGQPEGSRGEQQQATCEGQGGRRRATRLDSHPGHHPTIR